MPKPNMDLLPEDVLADVLGRLAPRSLAVCRSVCQAWCAIVDAHRLLRTDLLPLTLAGFYVDYHFGRGGGYCPPTFFSRPSTGDKIIHGNLGYLDAVRGDWSFIGNHCNGLILLYEGVVNPATRQSARLPRYPNPTTVDGFFRYDFLAFDPTVSSHFEVFYMQCLEHRFPGDTELDSSGWPPSPFVLSAFSSKTWRWEERSFVREGMAVRSVTDVAPFLRDVYHHDGVYWRGRLYVCQIYFIIRFSLEDNKYRVIQLPPMDEACGVSEPCLGKSEKGVYYGFEHGDGCKLQIWFLDESTDATEWTLKLKIDLKPLLASFPWKHRDGPWSVQGVNHEPLEIKEGSEWDSDNKDGSLAMAATEVIVLEGFRGHISVLGFHPYREIVFLHTWSKRVMAYHLDSSMLEDLGSLPLDDNDEIWSCCAYTPCWMESCLSANSFKVNTEL